MIYVDLGCHNGDSIKDFYDGKLINDIKTVGIKSIGIDPLNKYKKEWEEIKLKYNTLFINEAAYNYDGEINFSEKQQDVKSSVMSSKISYAGGKIYSVKCFDFSNFIKQFDGVILRMDIEGAEYPVLRKMIIDGTIMKVKLLGIEWHAHKMLDKIYLEQQKNIAEQLDILNIKWKPV